MKRGWIALVTVLVTVMLLAFFMLGGLAQDPEGFRDGELKAPLVTTIVRDGTLPEPLGAIDFPAHLETGISYTQVYQDYGGIIELLIDNKGSNQVYVRSYGLSWGSENITCSVNCSKFVSSGETLSMGVLYFTGPGTNGTSTFSVHMNLWASSIHGDQWSDKGDLLVGTQEVECLPEPELRDRDVSRNPVKQYNKLNELVDFEAVGGLMENVLEVVPGDYSVGQVLEAYELVRAKFPYLVDTDDHWQSVSETLALGTGDCEDHAILLSSLLTALGGHCRINLINGHAFPTVYVGNSTSKLTEVTENIRTYYGNAVPVHWIEDDLGYWLVVDTVGMPYAGGHPAASVPVEVSGGGSWNFQDGDWIMTIDVTGETVPGIVI